MNMSFDAMSGSKLLEPLSDKIGLPIDRVNFLFAHFMFIPLAFIYKLYLTKTNIPINLRHLYLLIPGVSLGFFCFGFQVLNLVFLTIITYILIIFCPSNVVQRFVFCASLIYLSYLHLVRMVYDYGSYTIDITGPSMIAIQKISLLGFSLHDGMGRKYESLLDSEKRVAIKRKPTIIEYFSFVLTFPTFMSGPTIHYHDYIEFVEGTNYSKHLPLKEIENGKKPSSNLVWLEKLSTSLFFAVLVIYVAPLFPVNTLADETYQKNTTLFFMMIYMIISTICARFKYYHAWKLGESHLNCCGFGFNGFDEKTKKPKWDLLSCVDIIPFELALSLKSSLEYWNKTTQNWLRFVAYDRTSKFKLLNTYLLSALWHGFYPGYYLTFLSGGLFTQAGRILRRHLRPLFLANKYSKLGYDVMTFIATKLAIAYLVFPFVILEFSASLRVYYRFYFIGHLACLIVVTILPSLIKMFKKQIYSETELIYKEKDHSKKD